MSICEDQPPRFQFTHPGRGATDSGYLTHVGRYTFQFTHPGRGATGGANAAVNTYMQFQFTHPGRGATKGRRQRLHQLQVSIHAPREGCDLLAMRLRCTTIPFQFTHPGRGATTLWEVLIERRKGFQFTHPGRGATGISSNS